MKEFLSKDILDEAFIGSFVPFHWVQKALGSCRIDARDRFVTAPTARQKLYSGVAIVTLCVFFALFALFFPPIRGDCRTLWHFILLVLGGHCFVSVINIFHVRFVNNEGNVQFFIRLHEIDRAMSIDRSAYVHDVFYRINVITVTFWTVVPMVLFVTSLAVDWRRGVCYAWIFYAQMTSAVEWMYFSNLIIYFYMRLRYINSIMINHLGIEDSSYLKMYKYLKYFHKTTLKELAAQTGDFSSSDVDVYLQLVFDALLQFTALFRFQMFFLCTKFVFLTTLSVECGILVIQNSVDVGVDRYIGPVSWTADFLILLFICIRWDEFFKELCETKNLATNILATHTAGPLRKKAGRMVRLMEESPPHFSVYGMWNMDASTVLQVFHILTTLTVTLLQFALL